MINRKPKFILYFSATHWDREWYRTFQDFRFALVQTMNKVISTLESDSSFSAFITDGQTSMVEDYLEAMPENKDRLTSLLKQKRIYIGPWYTMPDENLVSGESIIKNLLEGHAYTKNLCEDAESLKLGYVCDIFGHISQLPQIFKGFDIDTAVLGRGTNNHTHPAFFNWQSPNGTSCTTFKVPEDCGYGTFWFDVFFQGGGEKNDETIKKAVNYVEAELNRTSVPLVVLMDGMDHTDIHSTAPWIAEKLEEHFECPVKIGQVDSFINILNTYKNELPTVIGELQAPAKEMREHNKLISDTLSSRYDLKKMNDNAQVALEKKTAPLLSLAKLNHINLPYSLYDKAYKYLLKNHAHDSICGCSIDEVHDDMKYRFNQAQRIADGLTKNCFEEILQLNSYTQDSPDGKLKLTVFNTLAYPIERNNIKVTVDFPNNFLTTYDEMIPSELVNQFRVFDAENNEVEYQIFKIKNNSYAHIPGRLYFEKRNRYTILINTSVPSLSFAEFEIRPDDMPVRSFDSLRTGKLTAESETLKLEVTPNGSVCLTNILTGHKYNDLLQYIDTSETGDGWFHRPTVPYSEINSSGSLCSVEVLHDGPLACTFALTHIMQLPKNLEYDRLFTERNSETVSTKIVTTLTLQKNCTFIKINTKVFNNAKDHKLVLSLKTGINSDTYTADQAFAFVERNCGKQAETHNWKEPDKAGKAFGNIVLRKRADNSGFAFISSGGMHEAAAQNDKDGSLDITLMRCFGKTFLTDGQPNGQLQGEINFSGAIFPFDSNTSKSNLLNCLDSIQVQPLFATSRYSEITKGTDFISINNPNIRVSMFRPSKDNFFVLRLVNYSDESSCRITFANKIETAYTANMLEERLNPISTENNQLAININCHEIKTLLIKFSNTEKEGN